MKSVLIGLSLLATLSSHADFTTYSNDEGCIVQREQRANGVILHIQKGNQYGKVGYANDYSFGDFSYCANDETQINYYDGSQATGIIIACDAHRNGYKKTRGRADITNIGEELSEVSIDGQVKGFFRWKQDVKIECLNLIRE